MRDRRDAQRGFTLIEVLVALTLMSLVSLISWRGLEAVQHTGERIDERAEKILSLLRVLGQIERDILLHAGPDILSTPASAGAGVSTPRIEMPPGIAWNASTGLGVVRAAGDGRWQQVRWYLEDGSLFRAAGVPSHLLPLPVAETGVVVLEHVSALTVNVWQPDHGWAGLSQGGASNLAGRRGGAGLVGLEVSLFLQGLTSDKPYRKVVLLP